MRGFLNLFVLLVIVSCSQGGKSGGGKKKKTPDTPVVGDQSPALDTDIRMAPLTYNLPLMPSCVEKTQQAALPVLAEIIVDGFVGDWQSVSAQAGDVEGDADSGFDLTNTYMAKDQNGIYVYLAGDFDGAAKVSLRFSGLLKKDGFFNKVDTVEVSLEGSAIWINNGEATYEALRSQMAKSGEGVELFLSGSDLGGATQWPGWTVQLITKDAQGRLKDQTHTVSYENTLSDDVKSFENWQCRRWSGVEQGMVISYTQEVGLNRVSAEKIQKINQYVFDYLSLRLGVGELAVSTISAVIVRDAEALLDQELLLELGLGDHLVYFETKDFDAASLAEFPEGRQIEKALSGHLSLYLSGINPSLPTHLKNLFTAALSLQYLKEILGESYWHTHLKNKVQTFVDAFSVGSPVTMESLQRQYELAQGEEKLEAGRLLQSYYYASSLALSLAASPKALLEVWALLDPSAPHDSLVRELGNIEPSLASEWVSGRLFDGEFSQAYHPTGLGDTDGDGLVDQIEKLLGTDTEEADTDGDGWSDFAETVLGSSAQIASIFPQTLVADGLFSDWLELLPKKVSIDASPSSSVCPKKADITHFAALVTRDNLMIGGFSNEFFEQTQLSYWEALIETGGNPKYLVRGYSDKRYFDILDHDSERVIKRVFQKSVTASREVEWVIERRLLDHSAYFNEPGLLKIKLKTLYRKESSDKMVFCDETQWFSPYISLAK